MNPEFEHFCKWASAALAKHQVHSAVQNRLAKLLAHEFPDNSSIAEVSAVKGGRNDLIHYDQKGRLAVFELFCSTSQVPQDLRLLEQADAHWKIAVLLDREIRPELHDAYFHKKPQAFPFLWLSQVMMPSKEAECRQNLRLLLTTEPIHSSSTGTVVQTASGNGNILANAPQGEININQKKILRPALVREAGDISEVTAFAIQDLIRQLAQTDELAGKPASYADWHQKLKNRYKVASYRKLTVEQGESAILWLKGELGRKIPTLRRTNNDEWRKRIYKGIWAAARELGLKKPQVYQFAFEQLELTKPINSLKDLGEQNLELLRDKLRYLARKQR